jgi:glycosyltransferase involved in cell wall biosynthesis
MRWWVPSAPLHEPRRVGLNLLYLLPGRVGGSEIYAHRLVAALAAARPQTQFVAFAAREAAGSLRAAGWPANVSVRALPVPAAVKPARAAAELTLLPLAAARARVDLLHSLGTTSPLVTGRPSVVTILDLIYEHFPTAFPPAARLGLKALVGPAARRADRVIAISAAVKRDVVDRLRVPADRVDVVHLGFGMQREAQPTREPELRMRLGLGDGPVVLCVSAALVHKNLERLVDAFGRLGAELPAARLVIAGHAGREQETLMAHARAGGVGDRVVLTGWINAADLEGLYALAACCAYPSLHEGFGLPVLEAFARGVPVACSSATSLPEVAGDAAELFDPRDVDAMAAAVHRVLADEARAAELIRRGHERVTRFTWEAAAEGVLRTYALALRTRA